MYLERISNLLIKMHNSPEIDSVSQNLIRGHLNENYHGWSVSKI